VDRDARLPLALDRSLPLPVGVQIRGQIEYGVTTGDIPRGTRLPSVRELAGALEVSVATVAQAYRELGEQGLLESRPGLGTFVVDRPAPAEETESVLALRRAVDALFAGAERLGFSRAAAAEAVVLRAGQARPKQGLRVLFVGIHDEASQAYSAAIRGALQAEDAVGWTTFGRLDRSGRPPAGVDAYLTIANRASRLKELVAGAAPVVGLTFIPSRETRTQLAQLRGGARVAAVTDVPEFLPSLRRNVGRFAPHVDEVVGALAGAAGLQRVLRSCDAIVYGTGSGAVLSKVPPDVDAFEFRFEPDAHAIAALLPTLERVRSGRAHEEAP